MMPGQFIWQLRWLLSAYWEEVCEAWYTLAKRNVHVPGRRRLNGMRFYHTIQESAHLKTYELLTFEFFLLIILDHGFYNGDPENTDFH